MHEAKALAALGVAGQDLGFASQVCCCSPTYAIHQLLGSGWALPFRQQHPAVFLMRKHVHPFMFDASSLYVLHIQLQACANAPNYNKAGAKDQ